MLFVIKPRAFVSDFSDSLHVVSLVPLSTIIFHLARILISIGIFDESFDEIIVNECPLKFSAVVKLKTAFSLSFIFDPAAVIATLFIVINSHSVFLIVDPFSIVEHIPVIGVSALSVFHAVLPVALIYRFVGDQINQYAVSMLFSFEKFALVLHVSGFEEIKSFPVALAIE